jgi:hypothetical protein
MVLFIYYSSVTSCTTHSIHTTMGKSKLFQYNVFSYYYIQKTLRILTKVLFGELTQYAATPLHGQ